MSAEDDVAPVEQEYRREEHREQKAMDSKHTGAKFSSNILSRTFDDDRSVGSSKSGKPPRAQLFFQNDTAKVAAPIGQVSGSDDFPLLDGPWTYWLATQHPNAHKLSDHEKCNVECLNQAIRHQNATIDKLGHLLELHLGTDAEDATQQAMTTVLDVLQYIDIANDQCKCMLDDYDQKWKHTPEQFELNRTFARAHNPMDDSMSAGPDIYDNYKRQVNAYGETSVYKRD
jgi:hypothetical protein